jgi:hypothetical protein
MAPEPPYCPPVVAMASGGFCLGIRLGCLLTNHIAPGEEPVLILSMEDPAL